MQKLSKNRRIAEAALAVRKRRIHRSRRFECKAWLMSNLASHLSIRDERHPATHYAMLNMFRPEWDLFPTSASHRIFAWRCRHARNPLPIQVVLNEHMPPRPSRVHDIIGRTAPDWLIPGTTPNSPSAVDEHARFRQRDSKRRKIDFSINAGRSAPLWFGDQFARTSPFCQFFTSVSREPLFRVFKLQHYRRLCVIYGRTRRRYALSQACWYKFEGENV